MTDFQMLAGGLRVAGCGAIHKGITYALTVAGSRMGSAAGEKFALSAVAAGRSSWARIEGGNGRIEGRTRFVICYHLAVSLGEKALAFGFRWFFSWPKGGPAASRLGVAVQIQGGGGGDRARCAPNPSQYIQPRRKFSHCPPNYE